ncbi:hypothetical protein HY256_02745, partial [Candidatus Sumerlaeota bacterium]|nr:hypothetical protein [Candidatus Sumerlaeota bacterium]
MRLGLTGDGIVQGFFERLAIAFGVLPEPLVVSFWGMAAARSFIVGGNLGVFEALRDGPKSAEEIARATGCDPGGMETLLNSMNGFGFLQRGGGKYSNVKAVKWFVKPDPALKQEFFPPAYDLLSIFKWARRSSFSLHDIMPFFADIWDLMGGMEQAVRTGNPINFHHENRPPEFWERYLRTLATFARLASVEIVRKVGFDTPPRRLLDVGGGHGTYSSAFCHRY